MKLEINAAVPEYPQVSAQQLKIGQCIKYKDGNGVVRITSEHYLMFDTDGRIHGVSEQPEKLGHGKGDLLPKSSTLTMTL